MIRFYASLPHYQQHLVPIVERIMNSDVEVSAWRYPEVLPDDGVPVVIAGAAEIAMVPGSSPIALVSHGIDQSYRDVDHGSYAGGRNRERVSLFLCPNQRSADLNLSRYPAARAEVVGSPHVEALRSELGAGASALGGALQPEASRQGQRYGLASVPTVVLAWHWDLGICPETRSAWDHYWPVIERLRGQFRFVGHGHPRSAERLSVQYEALGIPWVASQREAFAQADLVVFDNTSAGYEAAACGIPVLAVDHPGYRGEVDHGLRFWDSVPGLRLMAHRGQRSEIGVVHPQWGRDVLGEAINAALLDPEETQTHREAVVNEVYAHIDGATALAADAIRDWAGDHGC